jgi:serine/threonine protein kinase
MSCTTRILPLLQGAATSSNSMSGARGPADQSLHVGKVLGGYRLLELLGQGHMGVVFRARREEDGESVALKILRDELAGDELYRRRFEREARIASELANEHVVPVVDFGEASGRLYIAALYVRGVSLSSRIASQGALSLSEAVHLVSDLAGALEALNARGLVHRDVKPANVMVDERGAAALTDFGLARGTAETVLTKTGMVVGTVDYLAPELIRGEQAGHSSDVYALGCLVYECLAGAPPFADKAYVETLLAHVQEEPRELSDLRADLPESVSWTVLRALAKDPAERPATATAYARLLRASAKTG